MFKCDTKIKQFFFYTRTFLFFFFTGTVSPVGFCLECHTDMFQTKSRAVGDLGFPGGHKKTPTLLGFLFKLLDLDLLQDLDYMGLSLVWLLV